MKDNSTLTFKPANKPEPKFFPTKDLPEKKTTIAHSNCLLLSEKKKEFLPDSSSVFSSFNLKIILLPNRIVVFEKAYVEQLLSNQKNNKTFFHLLF